MRGPELDKIERPFGAGEHVTVLGLPIWNPRYEEFKDWWDELVAGDGPPVLMGIANAHTLNLCCETDTYRHCMGQFDVVLNDGVGAAMAAKMRRRRFHYNFNGTDLFPRLFAEQEKELKVFLFGASEEANEGAARAISASFPAVKVVGRRCGFDFDDGDVVRQINNSGACVLLVALGQPAQELWLLKNRDRLQVRIGCGVGALLDFLSGRVRRAPAWMRKTRTEWVYRLAREPRRMWGRYVAGNPKFLVRAYRRRRADTP